MSMNDKIIITVAGPDKSGKGYIMSAIAHALSDLGALVTVQGAETHNRKKMEKSEEEIRDKLADKTVLIMEQQTT